LTGIPVSEAGSGQDSIADQQNRRRHFEPILMPHTSRVSPCYAYRYKREVESEDMYAQRLADELETEILRVGEDKVAAFFAETGKSNFDQTKAADPSQSWERQLATLLPCRGTSRLSAKFVINMVSCWFWTRSCAVWDGLVKCMRGSGKVIFANLRCQYLMLMAMNRSRHSDYWERAERRLPSSVGGPYSAASHRRPQAR
jgi:hypothetical protein